MVFFVRQGLAGSIPRSRLPRTPLPRKFTFTDPDKIRELAKKGEAWGRHQKAGRCWEHAIETGRGGVFLRLTPEQYARLARS